MAPERPRKPFERPVVRATMYVWSLMDVDNLYARMKWPLDWMEDREIIVNDRDVDLRVEQIVDRKNQRLEVEIT